MQPKLLISIWDVFEAPNELQLNMLEHITFEIEHRLVDEKSC